MKDNLRVFIKIIVYTLISFSVLFLSILQYGGKNLAISFTIGYLLSLFNVVLSFTSIRWGFKQKSKTFYFVVMGGMVIRFVIFVAITFVIIRFTTLPLSGFLVSFVIFYLFSQYHEIRFINSELNGINVKKT